MKTRHILTSVTALVLTGVTFSACTTAPPPPGGDGDDMTSTGGGTMGASGGATGDGDLPGSGGIVGDGDLGTGGTPPITGDPPYGHPNPATSYPTHDGFTLYLVEEFDQPLDLSTDPIWTYSDGGLPEGSVRFVKEGVQFADGKMILKTEIDEGAYQYQSCSHAENGDVLTKDLTSGEMRTRHNMFRYGRYETRMKAPSPQAADPSVNGNYIATMFTFRTPKFEDWREIDIEVTGNDVNTVTTNVIYGDAQFEWSAGIADDNAVAVEGINTRTEFHDFAFEWLPDSITWYVDGQEIRKYTQPAKRPIPNLAAKVMMNLWIFGPTAGFGGSEIENNQYPMQSEYEWFRFYKWDGDDTYPCPQLGTSCLTAEDVNLASNNPCDGIDASGTITGTAKMACVAACQ